MARPLDSDNELQALQNELRSMMQALNVLHHPVNPSDPDQIKGLEAQIAELKQAINERRASLASEQDRPIRLNRRSANA